MACAASQLVIYPLVEERFLGTVLGRDGHRFGVCPCGSGALLPLQRSIRERQPVPRDPLSSQTPSPDRPSIGYARAT